MNDERFAGVTAYLQPSTRLQGRSAEIFNNTVHSREPGFYRDCDIPALETYSKAKALLEKLEDQLSDVDSIVSPSDKGTLRVDPCYVVYEKQCRLVSSLMVKLRLVPNARVSKKVAARPVTSRKAERFLKGEPERYADPNNWRERLGLVE
jgi:hypothetical protein